MITTHTIRLAPLVLAGIICGCAQPNTVQVPGKIQFTDLSSGEIFTTYDDMPHFSGDGVNFDDLRTGDHVNLVNYKTHRIAPRAVVRKDSDDYKNYLQELGQYESARSSPPTGAGVALPKGRRF